MKQKILLTLFLIGVLTSLNFIVSAQETISTKEGSVYMGHTAQQIFDGRNSMTIFSSDSSIRVIPVEKVTNLTSEKRRLNDLPKETWQKWFASHPELVRISSDGDNEVTIHRLKAGDKTFQQVFLLERAPAHYKFYTMDYTRDTIPDESIISINYSPRNPSETIGVVDIVTTTDGKEYKGLIVSWSEQFTGLLNGDGTVELIPNNLISQKKIEGLNPNMPLINQVEYLDEVSGDFTVRGLITERNRRPRNNIFPYYTIFNDSDNENLVMDMKSVKTIKKRKNDKYKSEVPTQDYYGNIRNDVSTEPQSSPAPERDFQFDQSEREKSGLW